MQLIRPTTDLDVKDALILQVAEATHHLASVLATTNEQFWSFPTDRLLAVLNADIPATLATFAANTGLASAVNASLDALNLPQFPHRAPIEQGRSDIEFDGAVFVQVTPPEPEIEAEP
jgi:hypothetical protein